MPRARRSKKEEEHTQRFPLPTAKDYEVIQKPLITEKSMALMQEENKVTIVVAPKSNKIEIKNAFERIFQVKVTAVKVCNVPPYYTTRGTRYKGVLSGYKKAIVTVASGEAIDLFKE